MIIYEDKPREMLGAAFSPNASSLAASLGAPAPPSPGNSA